MIVLLWIGALWFIVAVPVGLVVGPLLKRRRVRETAEETVVKAVELNMLVEEDR